MHVSMVWMFGGRLQQTCELIWLTEIMVVMSRDCRVECQLVCWPCSVLVVYLIANLAAPKLLFFHGNLCDCLLRHILDLRRDLLCGWM